MCSIMGYCGAQADYEGFAAGFARTRSRGPDQSRVLRTNLGLLAFHRLAIMGLTPEGMQPFSLGRQHVVCNGEIYGYEALREQLSDRYQFRSGSDCEVLLPLYREYGTDMFSLLDAEFACILFDEETGDCIAARDPIGIRPLFYGYDGTGGIYFASEAKNLVGLTDTIHPFPPGQKNKNGQFLRRGPRAGPLGKGAVEPQRAQGRPQHHAEREYARGRQPRLVDQQLGQAAYGPAHEESLQAGDEQLHFQHLPLSMATAWQMAGMLSPCWAVVGLISAPVAAKSTRRQSPSRIPRRKCPVRTLAEQPQPEPPQCVSCRSMS